MVTYEPSKYRKKGLIRNIVVARKGTKTGWICQKCDGALKGTQFQLRV